MSQAKFSGQSYGMWLDAGASKISIAAGATVGSNGNFGTAGIYVAGPSVTITNLGEIVGYYGIALTGGGTNIITNKGYIRGDVNSYGSGIDTVTNNGVIDGGLQIVRWRQ